MFTLPDNLIRNCFYFCINCFIGIPLICLFLLSFYGIVFSNHSGKTIAVMPFFQGQKTDTALSAVETVITNFRCTEPNLSKDANIIMTKLLHKSLEKKSYRLIPMDTVLSVYEPLLKQEKDPTPLRLAVQLGKTLNADYVIAGNVWRFIQRSGNALASTQPASIGFKIHLISVTAEKRIWKGIADQTQLSLSENLLKVKEFFKHGARWLTAEELTTIELDKMLKQFPLKPNE